MPITTNEYNDKSTGGTELSISELKRHVDPDLLSRVEIIPGRFREFKTDLKKIFWVHDTENDPEMFHLGNGGWSQYDKIVFVSNWQMQRFVEKFKIPWGRCEVIYNAVDPLELKPLSWTGDLKFIYHTTPHRGLNVLVGAFQELAKKHDGVHLDVYSSFKIYGWGERDAQYEPLYDAIRNNPAMTYHGSKNNTIVRTALENTHVFAYPCTWQETGCRSLMEAMSAGVFCVHSNYGCLYETARGFNLIYQYDNDTGMHASVLYGLLDNMIKDIRGSENVDEKYNGLRGICSRHSSAYFSWSNRALQWNNVIARVINS